jgi:translation initiation factor IF-3
MANNQFYRGGFNNNKFKQKENRTRVNFYIKAPQVRVVQDGKQLGVFPIETARKLAMDAGLDLVEIVPTANPPVCSICDFDKFRYEQKQKEKESKKKQKIIELKEVRLRPCTQDNDIEIKVNAIKKFLSEGKKVMVNVKYQKRELSHKEEGFKIANVLIEQLKDFAIIEQAPRMEGKSLICRFAPKAKVGELT